VRAVRQREGGKIALRQRLRLEEAGISDYEAAPTEETNFLSLTKLTTYQSSHVGGH